MIRNRKEIKQYERWNLSMLYVLAINYCSLVSTCQQTVLWADYIESRRAMIADQWSVMHERKKKKRKKKQIKSCRPCKQNRRERNENVSNFVWFLFSFRVDVKACLFVYVNNTSMRSASFLLYLINQSVFEFTVAIENADEGRKKPKRIKKIQIHAFAHTSTRTPTLRLKMNCQVTRSQTTRNKQ
jgi:hypothetical protein